MANQDAAFGFRQVGGLGSRPTSNGTSKYVIASGYTSAIYAGDIVEMGAGTDESGAAIAAGYVGQAAATSSTRNVGIFNGCFYDDPTTRKPTFNNTGPGILTYQILRLARQRLCMMTPLIYLKCKLQVQSIKLMQDDLLTWLIQQELL